MKKIYLTRAYWLNGLRTMETHHTEVDARREANELFHEGLESGGKPERTEACVEMDGNTTELCSFYKGQIPPKQIDRDLCPKCKQHCEIENGGE